MKLPDGTLPDVALPDVTLPDGLFAETDRQELVAIVNQVMPFGRYSGRRLLELPEPYLVWFHARGFPHGRLGERMAVMYEVKLNGLEGLLRPLLDASESQ